MAGWLNRTTSLFKKQPPSTPEPFEVECDCGGRIVGQRSPSYQKPKCPVCDRLVFVRPANVYPRPKPPAPGSKSKSSQPITPTKSGRSPSNTVKDDRPPPIPLRSAAGKNATVSPPPSSLETEPAQWKEPRRPILTPLRIITFAILCISGLTFRFLWHRNAINVAQATVSAAADAGKAAVRENDFVTGAKELDRARRAVDLLGRKDQTADEIRRLSREATVLANLSSNSLTEILQETLSNARPGQSEPLRMASLDKNAWVIFDTILIPDPERQNRFSVDAPFQLGKFSVQIEIDSPLLAGVTQVSEETPRIIFAAQVEEMSAPQGDAMMSTLTLNGKTAILWTSYDTYYAVGFRPFDAEYEQQTKVLLERQREHH